MCMSRLGVRHKNEAPDIVLAPAAKRPAQRALLVLAVALASARLRKQGVEDFADHALACAG